MMTTDTETVSDHRERTTDPRVFMRLLGFLRPYRWRVALAVVLGVATVASNVALLGMAAYLIAAAALKPLLVLLVLPIYIVRVAGVARAVARYAERLVAHDATFRLLTGLRLWAYARLEPLVPAGLTRHRSGDLLARLVADVEDLQHIYLRVVAPLVVAAAIAAATFGVFVIFSATLAWVALAFLAVAGVGVPLLSAVLSRGLGRRGLAARAALNAGIVESIQGLPDVLACGRPAARRASVAALDHALAAVQRRAALIGGVQAAAHDLLMNLALWSLLALAIPLVANKTINGVYLAFLALVILASFEAVAPLGQAFAALGRATAAGERLFAVADVAPCVTEPPTPLPAPRARGGRGHTVEFDDVHFAYEPGAPVLNGVNVALRPGGRVAVVGPSGAGKSTLARLALRFGDPTAGTIRLDGQDVGAYALGDLRAAIGVVAQDTHIFNDTVRGNLLVARPEATDDDLEQALEGAQLHAFVRGLPDGLDTWVGEQGLRLAGGERQRLAIARALLKDAPLLILDEATANLDPLTERALLDALDHAMRGRALLIITHRLVAMERMDEIVVLDEGRIVERGTHAALRAAGGLYRRLLDVQDGMVDMA